MMLSDRTQGFDVSALTAVPDAFRPLTQHESDPEALMWPLLPSALDESLRQQLPGVDLDTLDAAFGVRPALFTSAASLKQLECDHAVDVLLTRHRGWPPRSLMAKDGRRVPADRYTENLPRKEGRSATEFPARRHNTTAIMNYLLQGATLTTGAMEEVDPGIRECNDLLEKRFHADTTANIYVSFGESAGFKPHCDRSHTVAIQYSGRKRWRVYGRRESDQPLVWNGDLADLGTPVIDRELQAGDVLYVPADHWHLVEPLDQETIHITFSLERPTVEAYTRWLLAGGDTVTSLPQELPHSAPEVGPPELWMPDGTSGMLTPTNVRRFQALEDVRAMSRRAAGLRTVRCLSAERLPPSCRLTLAGVRSPAMLDMGDTSQFFHLDRVTTVTPDQAGVLRRLSSGPASVEELLRCGEDERTTERLCRALLLEGVVIPT